MGDAEQIDKLLDLSLNSEASEEQVKELEDLCAKNNDNLTHYIESIDNQVFLKDAVCEGEFTPAPQTPSRKKATFPFWLIGCVLILALSASLVTYKKRPTTLSLSIASRTHGLSLIRKEKELINNSGVTLQTDDLLQVSAHGELWLDFANKGKIYAHNSSIIKVNQLSQESFTLVKGELSAQIPLLKAQLIFSTPELEIRTHNAEFTVSSSNGSTEINVLKGKVDATRLTDGKQITLSVNDSINSLTMKVDNNLTVGSISLFPELENGLRYYYHETNKKIPGVYDSQRLIDQGLTNRFAIQRGAHEGYARHAHDKHSHIHNKDFHITFEGLILIDQDAQYTFRLSGTADSKIYINGKTLSKTKSKSDKLLTLSLNKGYYNLKLETIGIIENDAPGESALIEIQLGKNEFREIPPENIFFSNYQPLPKMFLDGNIDKSLSAHLPLKGNFRDKVYKEDVATFGDPQFIKDERFGLVLDLDGKDDYLVHFPVDKLGMNLAYTACTWVKLTEEGHYDQTLFANASSSGVSTTLVLLLRRLYPYHAHLANDSIADEQIEYGKWAHVAFRYHQGKQSIFFNGELAVSSFNHSILSSNSPLEIGRWSHRRTLLGRLRDVRIYNAALHADDIKSLYEKTK
ncbi:MAG: PA14 domain-containing protein [Lentisphaeraceae bacterium]|nr:PA14 domain-containing protein [Lentisphaeraceae bacterium]